MPKVYYSPSDTEVIEVDLQKDQSVLDGLLSAGFEIPFGCKGGVCQSCILKSSETELPKVSQNGLKQTQIKNGMFLSCRCFPNHDISVSHSKPTNITSATITDIVRSHPQVLKVKLDCDIEYTAGQFVTLWKDEKTARSYSIASTPQIDKNLEFHIKYIKNGAFSSWIKNQATAGSKVKLQGPLGECFYTSENPDQPILLGGIGTGLAPLFGIVKDALMQHHSGDISLIIGAKNVENFYLLEELKQLQREYKNFRVHFVCLEGEFSSEYSPAHTASADIYEYIKTTFSSLAGFKVYLCGADTFVRKAKKLCFLQGANMQDISADTFLAFK